MSHKKTRFMRTGLVLAVSSAVALSLAPFTQTAQAAPNEAPNIIPALQEWVGAEGQFVLDPDANIVVDAEILEIGEQFAEDLEAVTGASLTVTTGAASDGDFILILDEATTHGDGGVRFDEEGYILEADADNLTITAPSGTGVFYGTRTALQGLVQSPGRSSFPAGETIDWPDYETRGFMLDVGRRFFTAEFIRDYIKMMSWYKMNEFQIHLNDNEIFRPAGGWEAAYAGFRLKSENEPYASLASEDGSYDRADWQSFEDTAAAHSVMIIPEIDVPAHSLAFVKWDPELGLNSGYADDGTPIIGDDHLDLTPGNYEYTTETIKGVFDEFIPWFEGPDVHFGADEYSRTYAGEYLDFFNDMAEHIRDAGKQPRAWGSAGVMHNGDVSGYDKDVIIHAWNQDWYGMVAAEEDGYEYINMNDGTLYVVPFADYYHGNGLNDQGLYTDWLPNRTWSEDLVPAGSPRGSMFAVWNDLVNADYTQLGVHGLIEGSFPVIAQKTWAARTPSLSYAQFTALQDAVAQGPGLTLIDEPQLATGDLTGDATVTASASTEDHPADSLIDGLKYSRWSAGSDEASFTIDLGAGTTVGQVEVEWAQPMPATYDVEISLDGETWALVGDDVAGDVVNTTFDAAAARYVRVSASADGDVSAWSAKVFAPAPLTEGATATASGNEAASLGAENAVDGNLTTRWSANYTANPWIQVDLGEVKSFEEIQLYWEAATATAYNIQISDDGENWTTLVEKSDMAAGARNDVLEFETASARYVRVTVDEHAMYPYLSLYEIVIPAPSVEIPSEPEPEPTVTVTPTVTETPTVTVTPTTTVEVTAETTVEVTQTVRPTATVTVTPTGTAKPTDKPTEDKFDVYTTPGTHDYNGRQWFTECEPYSKTVRCRTEIWATQVTLENGSYVSKTGWVFNNLTYVDLMTKSEWGTNPLANTGEWTAADGRKWKTECNTAATGANGCRSYAWVSYIGSEKQADGSWKYFPAQGWVLNNIVRFKA